MKVSKILYDPDFVKDLKKIDPAYDARIQKSLELFQINPLHPSLRLHPLKGKLRGLWSLSITTHIRIIINPLENGVFVFLSIGKHDVYRSL